MEKTNDTKDKKLVQVLQENAVLIEIIKALTHESKIMTNCFSSLFNELSEKDVLSVEQLKNIGQCLETIHESQKLTMKLMEMVKFNAEEDDADVTVES